MKTGIANVDLTQGQAVKIVAEDTLKGGRKYAPVGAGERVDGIVDNAGKAGDLVGIETQSGAEVLALVTGAVAITDDLVAGANGTLIKKTTETIEPYARPLQASAGGELIKVEIL